MKYKDFKEQALGDKCMSCLGRIYHINLRPTDCVRTDELSPCYSCGKDRRIVEDIKLFSRLKLLTVIGTSAEKKGVKKSV